jgi:iron complex outermembrane recepter protein
MFNTQNTCRATALTGLLLSTALLGLAAPALAQTAPAANASGDDRVTDIVVTATRRAEPLSKISQSITALTEDAMDARGIKDIRDITRMTPGIEFNQSGFGTNADISIRGISSLVGAATTGIYIDDTPIQARVLGYSSTNTYPLVFDLDRVEVLRGPQGTLFGAGAEGGAIRFITPKPSLTDTHVYGRTELSGTDGGSASYEAGVAINAPLIQDKLGFSASVWLRHDGGYVDRKNANPEPGFDAPIEKNANYSDTQVARAALAWAASENLTITPSIFYQNRKINDIGSYWEGLSAAGAGKFVNGQPLAQPDHDQFVLPALDIHYDFGSVTLISNTSMFKRRDEATLDYSTLNPAIFSAYTPEIYFAGPNWVPDPFNPGHLDTAYASSTKMLNEQTVWTQELRLQSNDASAKLTWVAGLFLSSSKQTSDETIYDPSFTELFGYPAYYGSYYGLIDGKYSLVGTGQSVDKQAALFGEANYKVTDQLKLTVGVRVARTSFTGSAYAAGPFAGTEPIVQPSDTVTETPVTPKAVISYQIDNNNLIYFSAAKGYRIGGTSAPVSDFCNIAAQGYDKAPAEYHSDSLWSYEVGTKNQLIDHRLEVLASAYHINWSNIQQVVYISNCGQQFVDNLGKATSNGFDVQLTAHPVKGLTLNGAVGFTSATYSTTIPYLVQKGDHIDTNPWSAIVGANYDFTAFNNHEGYFRADYTYHSSSALTAIRNPLNGGYDPGALPAPETNYLTLRGGLRFTGVDVSLFIDNVTNTAPALTRYSEVLGNPVYRDLTFRPRTIGMTMTYRQ